MRRPLEAGIAGQWARDDRSSTGARREKRHEPATVSGDRGGGLSRVQLGRRDHDGLTAGRELITREPSCDDAMCTRAAFRVREKQIPIGKGGQRR